MDHRGNISSALHTLMSNKMADMSLHYFNIDEITEHICSRSFLFSSWMLTNSEIVFEINKYGKPFLSNVANIYFNLSHSGEWIICAVADGPVGIDIEKMKPVDYTIMFNQFSKEEVSQFMQISKEDKLDFFYQLWTCKESYIKAVGKGLSIPLPLHTFSVTIHQDNIDVQGNHPYFIKCYDVEPGYKMAICSYNNKFPEQILYLDLKHILTEFI